MIKEHKMNAITSANAMRLNEDLIYFFVMKNNCGLVFQNELQVRITVAAACVVLY